MWAPSGAPVFSVVRSVNPRTVATLLLDGWFVASHLNTESDTMKKPVPDPPSHVPRFTTAHTPFGHCQDNQKPLFAVCAGVDIEDALIHLSMTLQSTYETTLQVCELADRTVGDLAWRSCQSLEISRALVRALLEGIAGQRGR